MFKYTLIKYHTKSGWRWKIKHQNGNIIATGGQGRRGYRRPSDMDISVGNLFRALGPGNYHVVVKAPKGSSYRG